VGDRVPGEPMRRLLILCGQPGIGKSTTVQVLCSELGKKQSHYCQKNYHKGVDLKRWGDTYGLQGGSYCISMLIYIWEIVAYDKRAGAREASDYREHSYESQLAAWGQFIRESRCVRKGSITLYYCSRYGTLVNRKKRSHDDNKTVLLLDELPSAGASQQEATCALLQSFYGDENDDSLAAPAVLVWSSGIAEKSEARLVVERQLGASLLARASVVCLECNPVTEKKVAKVLSAIAKAESKTLPQRAVDMLSAQAQGDLRRAITALDFAMTRR
jgi:DNA polymerase III delta prime subunit